MLGAGEKERERERERERKREREREREREERDSRAVSYVTYTLSNKIMLSKECVFAYIRFIQTVVLSSSLQKNSLLCVFAFYQKSHHHDFPRLL